MATIEFDLPYTFTPSELMQMIHDLEVEFGIETKEQVGV